MPHHTALGTHEDIQSEDRRRFAAQADQGFVSLGKRHGLPGIVGHHLAGAAQDPDPHAGTFGKDQMIHQLGAVAEGQAYPRAENAVSDASVVGRRPVDPWTVETPTPSPTISRP